MISSVLSPVKFFFFSINKNLCLKWAEVKAWEPLMRVVSHDATDSQLPLFLITDEDSTKAHPFYFFLQADGTEGLSLPSSPSPVHWLKILKSLNHSPKALCFPGEGFAKPSCGKVIKSQNTKTGLKQVRFYQSLIICSFSSFWPSSIHPKRDHLLPPQCHIKKKKSGISKKITPVEFRAGMLRYYSAN